MIEGDGHPGFGLSRLPLEILPQINEGAAHRALNAANCEIRGMLAEGGEARIVLQTLHANKTVPVTKVYHGCFCDQVVMVGQEPVEVIIRRPDKLDMMMAMSRDQKHAFAPDLVRVLLPPVHQVRILSIEGDLTFPEQQAVPEKTLLSYGSSITQGAWVTIPEGTYPAQCAQRLGYDVINLGFAGSAKMDLPIAEHIASRSDWDVVTLEMGVNVKGWPLDKFRAAVEQFVATIVKAHSDKPVFCFDMFTHVFDYEDAPTDGLGFREAVKDIVSNIGSPKVHYIDGRTLLTQTSGLRSDLLHPTDAGMQEIGLNLAGAISEPKQVGARNGARE